MESKLICTVCPVGCRMTVLHDGKSIGEIEGNLCPRGMEYAGEEVFRPTRVVTTTARILGAAIPLVPVRTDRPVPKDRTFEVVRTVLEVEVKAPVAAGEILMKKLLGLDINLIATRSLDRTEEEKS